MIIIIKVASEIEQITFGSKLHDILVGNEDYIENNIILNIEKPQIIELVFFPEANVNDEQVEKIIKTIIDSPFSVTIVKS